MIIDITRETHDQIKNRRLAEYAAIYLGIFDDFMGQVTTSGIEVDTQDFSQETAVRIEQLRQKGAVLRNSDRSIYLNAISPACVACQKGVGSATFVLGSHNRFKKRAAVKVRHIQVMQCRRLANGERAKACDQKVTGRSGAGQCFARWTNSPVDSAARSPRTGWPARARKFPNNW